jgi:putative ABC transport system permease protein
LLGLVIGLLGLGVMAYGVTRLDSLVLVVGIVTAELGVVLVMPWLVVRTAAVAGRLPLGPRIAVRDAGRHRMRTTAAACAIAAAAAAAVGTTAAAGSLSYGYQYSDVPVAPGVVAVTDEGYAYGETDGQARPSDHIAAVLAAVDRADPDARATVLRPVSGAAGYDPATGAGWVSCGDDPASVSYSDGQTPTPCQGRGYRLSGANVVLIEPADVDLALGPAAPLDDVRAALARGDAVVLEPNAVTDGRVQLWVAGPMDMDGLPTSSTAVDVPAVEVLLGAVPAQVLVGPAFLERGEVKGVLVSAPNGGVVLSAPSAPDTADRPTFEDRVGVELVRDEVPAYVYNPPQFTDDAVVVAAIAAGATMLMALLAGLMVTALALADGRADVGTLAAVGAPPRVRRRMAASSAGYVSLLGCVVGALSGLVAGRLLLPLAQPDTTWRTPWLVLVLIVVVVPLLTAGTAWVTTRSKVEMVRRLDS